MTTRADWLAFDNNCWEALHAQLETVDGLPVLAKRAYENIRLEPVPPDTYVRIRFAPGPREPVGFGPLYRAIGSLFVDVFVPVGFDGLGVAYGLANEIEVQFNPGVDLVAPSGQVVHCRRTYRSQSRESGVHLLVPVTIEYWADILLFSTS